MALFKYEHIGTHTHLYIWKIEEEFDDLFDEIHLTDMNMIRLMSMKSVQHQRGFLSVRKLFQAAGYTDFDVTYDATGKPHLNDGHHISISHSHGFSAIMISDTTVGIDLELMREKIIRIADKFTSEEEEKYLDASDDNYVKILTVLWGVKESIFKIRNEIGISFKDHITTFAFDINSGIAHARLDFEDIHRHFEVKFQTIEDHMLVYAFETANEKAL
ncbi:4'-phosphopantetheinyl transferase family protein [Flavobacterium silvaticum]|uniref:4'-phosphopantetheinyl transferase superfamily protein n=1 Tax=Flavobacterium silvaticum TaxID=1852020 RepID=A0A972JI80_9FLAO|nr:4'-phosphopantetheinyl transferase superfamily protein [Flavobacterium silvaticum]NMH27042.1 4'-phosphopantetheinyl transferase superfamily protein [Flavobacterium silvaticum]